MQKIYTAKQIAQLLSFATGRMPVTRQAVSILAKRRKFRVVGVDKGNGRTKLYDARDVDAYFAARKRTGILLREGWWKRRHGGALNEDATFDMVCPTCGAFAVKNPSNTAQWTCFNGHGGVEWRSE